jgi:hypothetical protein
MGQVREDAQVQTLTAGIYTTQNLGRAEILTLLANVTWRPLSWLDLSDGVSLVASQIESLGTTYPYMPWGTAVLSAVFHSPGGPGDEAIWRAGIIGRLATSALANPLTGARISEYGYIDLDARTRVWPWPWRSGERRTPAFFLGMRLENVIGTPIEFVQGYPTPGRIFVVQLSAEI